MAIDAMCAHKHKGIMVIFFFPNLLANNIHAASTIQPHPCYKDGNSLSILKKHDEQRKNQIFKKEIAVFVQTKIYHDYYRLGMVR